jgi:hypothetical protein
VVWVEKVPAFVLFHDHRVSLTHYHIDGNVFVPLDDLSAFLNGVLEVEVGKCAAIDQLIVSDGVCWLESYGD